MNIIFYIIIFVIGILFGSFYTLAIHRIPKKQDITHTRSYCPNCGHKLNFGDLIPVLSYVFLKGKCRYCKNKIKPQYLIIEILSGILFVMIAILSKFNIYTITITKSIEMGIFALYITFGFLLAGIDRENIKINKPVLMYGIIISIMYIVYLSIIGITSIYRYVIYLVLYIIILLLDTITLRKQAKDSYVYGILLTILIMAIFTTEYITMCSIIITLLAISIYIIINKIRCSRNKRTEKRYGEKIPIGFYLLVSNLIVSITALAIENIII